MQGILKFERDVLKGKDLVVRKKEGNTSFENHWHNYYEIIYYGNCSGTCNLNGKIYDIKDNCLFLLTPTDFHEIKNEESADSFSINISFTENSVDKKILKEFLTSAHIMYDMSSHMQDLFFNMNSIYSSSHSKRKDSFLYHTLNLILLHIAEYGFSAAFNKMVLHPVINDALIYLITSKDRDISLQEIAEKHHISPAYFSVLFRKDMGMTYSKYINKLRLDYAKRLLETTDMHIIDICYECGFKNNSHFVRTFTETIGLAPSAYRKNLNAKSKNLFT